MFQKAITERRRKEANVYEKETRKKKKAESRTEMMMKVQVEAENCEKVFDIFQCYTFCMRPVTEGKRAIMLF